MYPKNLSDIADRNVRIRASIERRIVRKTVDALLAAGYALQTDQGGGELTPATPTRDREVIFDALVETDDEHLLATKGDEQQGVKHTKGWVYFVYGNDGWDVISDYTTNLEQVLEPVNEYANSFDC